MGLISQALDRALPSSAVAPITKASRTNLATRRSSNDGYTASGIEALRRVGPSNVSMYRAWATQGDLPRSALDIKIGRLVKAQWDLVPADPSKPYDQGLMDRMREILAQPNPGEEDLGTFFQAIGEDLWTLDAAPFEKERTYRGELVYLWPVDGAKVKIDRLWSGDPREARYWFCPTSAPSDAIPMLDEDIGYCKVHHRSYSPMGIPPFETLKNTIDAELQGSMYNARQVTQAAPDGIMDLGETARPDQVEGFKSIWNSLIAGKSMMAFWGGTKGAKFIPFKNSQKDMQFLEWQEYLVRKFCAVMELSPQDLGFSFDINKSTGEVQQGQTDDRGLFGLARVQALMTTRFCWDPGFGGRKNNIAFKFTQVSDRQSKVLADIQKNTVAGMPTESINEARKAQGKPPVGDPADESNPYNKLMANTPQGLVLLEDIPTARELAMRGMNPDGTKPEPEPPPEAPKQVSAGILELSKGITDLSVAVASRPVSVTIEKGAIQQAEQSLTVEVPGMERLSDVAATMQSAADEVRAAVNSINELPAPIVTVNPGEVSVEPAVVNLDPVVVPAPAVNVEATDLTPLIDAVKDLKETMIKREPGPVVRREVKRDANGRIIDVIDHREA